MLKFIARKIGEKEFTFWECARSPMKTAANSKFMTLFGVHNCRRRAELLASLRPSRILNTYNADTDSRVVVPLHWSFVGLFGRSLSDGGLIQFCLSFFGQGEREREAERPNANATCKQFALRLSLFFITSSVRKPVRPSVSRRRGPNQCFNERPTATARGNKEMSVAACVGNVASLSALSSLLVLSQSHVSSDNGISRGHSLFSFSLFFLLISPF